MGHLFCTLISENQGLEKLRSASNLRKTRSCTPGFFFCLSPDFFLCLWYKSEKKSRWQTEKNSGLLKKKFMCAGPEIFLRFEADLNFSRPWFSEIKVQNKWPIYSSLKLHNRDRVIKCRHLSMSPSSPSLLVFQKFVYFRRGQKLSFEQVLWAERIPGHHPFPKFPHYSPYSIFSSYL